MEKEKVAKKESTKKWSERQKEIRSEKKLQKIFAKRPLESSWSYLYLVKCNECYKIGITFDIENRLNSLQCGNPYKLDLVIATRNPDAKELEKILHKKFESKRIRREWFKLSQEDIDFIVEPIKEIKKAYEKEKKIQHGANFKAKNGI